MAGNQDFNDKNYNLLGIFKETSLPAKIWKASTKLWTNSNENLSSFQLSLQAARDRDSLSFSILEEPLLKKINSSGQTCGKWNSFRRKNSDDCDWWELLIPSDMFQEIAILIYLLQITFCLSISKCILSFWSWHPMAQHIIRNWNECLLCYCHRLWTMATQKTMHFHFR